MKLLIQPLSIILIILIGHIYEASAQDNETVHSIKSFKTGGEPGSGPISGIGCIYLDFSDDAPAKLPLYLCYDPGNSISHKGYFAVVKFYALNGSRLHVQKYANSTTVFDSVIVPFSWSSGAKSYCRTFDVFLGQYFCDIYTKSDIYGITLTDDTVLLGKDQIEYYETCGSEENCSNVYISPYRLHLNQENNFSINPNPVLENVNFEYKTEPESISLYGINGNFLYHWTKNGSIEVFKKHIINIAPGHYYLVIKYPHYVIHKSMIKL